MSLSPMLHSLVLVKEDFRELWKKGFMGVCVGGGGGNTSEIWFIFILPLHGEIGLGYGFFLLRFLDIVPVS